MVHEVIRKAGFPYSFTPSACATCPGRCCRGSSGYIWIGQEELDRIVAFLGTNRIDFMADFVRQVDNRLSLREQWTDEEAVCRFFDLAIRACRIYPVRPIQCREFPFWAHFRSCPEELIRECPGVRI